MDEKLLWVVFMNIRPIEEYDNLRMGKIIREVLTEYGANRPGFAWQDPELDRLSSAYEDKDRYYVVDVQGQLAGGGGFARFECDMPGVCEIQKMYLGVEFRGKGFGYEMLRHLLAQASRQGFTYAYLESFSSMIEAISLYEKLGFTHLSKPLGNSGHGACDVWMGVTL